MLASSWILSGNGYESGSILCIILTAETSVLLGEGQSEPEM